MSSATESQATEASRHGSQATGPTARRIPPIDSPASETPVAAEKIGAGASAEDARAIAEAARETEWGRPSFAKGLYLGSFDLGLIHPWPAAKADDVERGEAFMEQLTELCRTMSGRMIERDAKIPGRVPRGTGRPRRVRHENPAGVRRPGPVAGVLRPGAGAAGLGAPQPGRPALGPPVHRRAGTGEGVRHPRAETEVPAALCGRGHYRVPAHRARRRQRPRPDGQHRCPHGRRRGLTFWTASNSGPPTA